MNHKITVVKRSADFMAYIDDNRARWGCGVSRQEAIGDVVCTHPEVLDLEIVEEE